MIAIPVALFGPQKLERQTEKPMLVRDWH